MEPLPNPAPRPDQVDGWGARLRAWIVWIGVARLVAASVSIALVAAGGFWLLQNPPPSTEASLPAATTSTPDRSAGSTTLHASSSTPVPASVPGSNAPAEILVHVAGAVVEPGVYRLGGEARIHDALVAAGGPTADADWHALNLAAPLRDGTRIYVPAAGEEAGDLVTGGDGAGNAVDATGDDPPGGADAPVDLNRAGVAELDRLPGIGPATAAAIVEDRQRNGPFASVDDLERVRGIGPAKVAALRDLVTT